MDEKEELIHTLLVSQERLNQELTELLGEGNFEVNVITK